MVNGTSVLLHLSHFSSLCDAHLWSYKASKLGTDELVRICLEGVKTQGFSIETEGLNQGAEFGCLFRCLKAPLP